MTTSLSIGVPMDVIFADDDRYIVVCDKLPMLLVGKDPAAVRDQVDRALKLVANYLLTLSTDDASAYLRRRGVHHSFADTGPAVTSEERTFRYGGGVLAHA